MFLVVLGAMSVIGFLFWKGQLRDLMDEVYDCGSYLEVKKRGEEDTILLSNITDVNSSVDRDRTGARIILTLESPCKFGGQISFAPRPEVYMGPHQSRLHGTLLYALIRLEIVRMSNLCQRDTPQTRSFLQVIA
jgi:hypothetical protein